jgi:hypothetical protein
MRTIPLFTLFDLKTTISPVGIVSFLVAIPLLALIATAMLPLSFLEALLAGVLSAAVMFVSEWTHQYGHARAARSVGHPMIGVHYHSFLSGSVYPADEVQLPALDFVDQGFRFHGVQSAITDQGTVGDRPMAPSCGPLTQPWNRPSASTGTTAPTSQRVAGAGGGAGPPRG